MKKLIEKIKDTLSIFSSSKGFTLLELLVVVLIIGILAMIALPQYQYVVDKSKFTQLLILSKAIKDAQHRYILAHGERSLDLSVLDIGIDGATYSKDLTENDTVKFKNGFCALTQSSSRNSLWCRINKNPKIYFFIHFDDEVKYCCVPKETGKRGERICENAFNTLVKVSNSNSYCGTDAKLYKGY